MSHQTSKEYLPMGVILYYRTTDEAARAILHNGFDRISLKEGVRGVWLSAIPLDVDEGAKGNALLQVELFHEDAFNDCERAGRRRGGLRYWEYLVHPAETKRGTITRLTEEEALRKWPRMAMVNGKPLHECTNGEMARFCEERISRSEYVVGSGIDFDKWLMELFRESENEKVDVPSFFRKVLAKPDPLPEPRG
jgi:hypothetical protein